MERVVTPITQIYIANQTLNDFLFVLPLVFEGDLRCVIKFIRPNIVTILAVILLQCMYPGMPLSVLHLREKVSFHPILCDVMCLTIFQKFLYPGGTREIMFISRPTSLRSIQGERTAFPNQQSKWGVVSASEQVNMLSHLCVCSGLPVPGVVW
jgi:hypothetical protein